MAPDHEETVRMKAAYQKAVVTYKATAFQEAERRLTAYTQEGVDRVAVYSAAADNAEADNAHVRMSI